MGEKKGGGDIIYNSEPSFSTWEGVVAVFQKKKGEINFCRGLGRWKGERKRETDAF